MIFFVRPLKYANFHRQYYPSCVTSCNVKKKKKGDEVRRVVQRLHHWDSYCSALSSNLLFRFIKISCMTFPIANCNLNTNN